jgi:hypothetical protein
MPEQLTKHPEVTLQVLRSAGATCGEGAPQQILVSCPPARFCKMPGGEVCIYGLAEAPKMTQITVAEWESVLSAVSSKGTQASQSIPGLDLLSIAVGLALGVATSLVVSRLRPHRDTKLQS